jgi:hypothetical protein
LLLLLLHRLRGPAGRRRGEGHALWLSASEACAGVSGCGCEFDCVVRTATTPR